MDTTSKIIASVIAFALLLHAAAAFLTAFAATGKGRVQAIAGLAAADLDKAGTLLESVASAAAPVVSLVVHAATGSTVNVHPPVTPASEPPALPDAPAAGEVKS